MVQVPKQEEFQGRIAVSLTHCTDELAEVTRVDYDISVVDFVIY